MKGFHRDDFEDRDDRVLEAATVVLANRWAPPSAFIMFLSHLTFHSISLIASARHLVSCFDADSSKRAHSFIIDRECSVQESLSR